MKNKVKFSIEPLFDEAAVVGNGFAKRRKKELANSLQEKYGGEIEFEELRILLPFNIKNGD
ncbi:hypothetical protein [Bacteroides heparinolyticus]|uniref:hypothetical protein n=1 Tax=Prevotella heparinolytica TaxID=28113 RepID=UPI00359FF27D